MSNDYLLKRLQQKISGKKEQAKKGFRGIAPISLKREEENKEYFRLREIFLEKHPICQCGRNCGLRSTDVHHTKKRGKYFLVVSTWKALNRVCHRWVTDNPVAAKKLGL